MAAGATGRAGAERVNRFRTAPRGEAGPNTSFIDCFNADLMPGLEMSGGYGLFQPGGRLPAHVHDFDESICIIDGRATCIVEGRRYALSDGATAMVPRGRVHYFINESAAPMAMLWVYAGPLPLRIVVAEACATAEGNPWR
jgi:quercetin dioxygenase-like cupin family protein